jgi:RimJ/RimL family protein N-acetyltransferase
VTDDIPTLRTERLELRALSESDLEAFTAMMADERVYSWLGGKPSTAADAWRSMASFLGHWSLRGYGQWALEERESGSFVGRAGLWNPHGWPGLEVGWTVAADHWGKGYATEAGRASLEWGFATLDVDEIISLTRTDNAASQRVMTKLGLHYSHDIELLGHQQGVYRITRQEWDDRG